MLSSVASGKHSDFGKIAFIAGDQTHCLNQATHITPASRHFDLLEMVAVHIQIYDTYDMNGTSSHVMVCTLPKPSNQVEWSTWPQRRKGKVPPPPAQVSGDNHTTQKVCLRVRKSQEEAIQLMKYVQPLSSHAWSSRITSEFVLSMWSKIVEKDSSPWLLLLLSVLLSETRTQPPLLFTWAISHSWPTAVRNRMTSSFRTKSKLIFFCFENTDLSAYFLFLIF